MSLTAGRSPNATTAATAVTATDARAAIAIAWLLGGSVIP